MRKEPKTIEIRGQLRKKFFKVPTSHIQMGSLCAKNAMEKFSRLGTFKESAPTHTASGKYTV
jgi:hypothetical protein